VFQIVVSLKPNDYSARGSLALLLYSQGRRDAAKQEAVTALAHRDELYKAKTVDIPDEIASSDQLEEFKNMLMTIASGGTLD
jgi:hypothetical protein